MSERGLGDRSNSIALALSLGCGGLVGLLIGGGLFVWLFLGVSSHLTPDPDPFDPGAWRTAKYEPDGARAEMIDSFLLHHYEMGMEVEALRELLGPPDREVDGARDYYQGPAGSLTDGPSNWWRFTLDESGTRVLDVKSVTDSGPAPPADPSGD